MYYNYKGFNDAKGKQGGGVEEQEQEKTSGDDRCNKPPVHWVAPDQMLTIVKDNRVQGKL